MEHEVYRNLEMIDPRFGETAHKGAVKLIMDTHEAPEEFAEQLVTFSSVLKTGRYKAEGYIKAVQYASYRQMNLSMVKSYKMTWPNRCFRDGKPKPTGTVDALASIYDKTAIVQGILSQMQIPLHIMMMSERVRAANVLANLMINADNERVQMEAADKLLNHINVPEALKVELDVGFKADETLTQLNETLTKISAIAQDRIKAGLATPTQVIES